MMGLKGGGNLEQQKYMSEQEKRGVESQKSRNLYPESGILFIVRLEILRNPQNLCRIQKSQIIFHQRKPKRRLMASRASDGLDAWDVFSVNIMQLQAVLPSGTPYLCASPPRMQLLL